MHRDPQSARAARLLDSYVKATQLIIDLLEDPARNEDAARQLLQCCWDGYPVAALRPLLRHADTRIQSAAAFVASELGFAAAPLLDDAIALLGTAPRHVQAAAMEVVAVCTTVDRVDRYVALATQLDHPDDVLRRHAESLVDRASAAQRAVTRRHFETLGRPADAARWGAP